MNTADILAARRWVNENASASAQPTSAPQPAPALSLNPIYSQHSVTIYSGIIDDIQRNGFEVRCIQSGVRFNVRPNGSICRELIKSLEQGPIR